MNEQQPSIRQVAVEAGVHFTTAARALRGASGVAEDTLKRVRAAADRLGYRPNPMVSALMASHRRGKPPPEANTLIAVAAWPSLDPTQLEFWRREYAGAKQRAMELGFRLEVLNYFASTPQRFEQILRARGIQALLILPVETGVSLELDWSRFATVTLGNTYKDLRHHRVAPSYTENLRLALQHVEALGYQRPGLVIPRDHLYRTGGGSLHGYVGECWVRWESIPVKPLIEDYACSAHRIKDWMQCEKPDIVLSLTDTLDEKLRLAGFFTPQDCGFVSLSIHDLNRNVSSGIDQRLEIIGSRAVDVLFGMLNRNERGLPETPMSVLHTGRWITGKTTRSRVKKQPRRVSPPKAHSS